MEYYETLKAILLKNEVKGAKVVVTSCPSLSNNSHNNNVFFSLSLFLLHMHKDNVTAVSKEAR